MNPEETEQIHLGCAAHCAPVTPRPACSLVSLLAKGTHTGVFYLALQHTVKYKWQGFSNCSVLLLLLTCDDIRSIVQCTVHLGRKNNSGIWLEMKKNMNFDMFVDRLVFFLPVSCSMSSRFRNFGNLDSFFLHALFFI